MTAIHWGIIGCGNVCEKKAGPALSGVEGSNLAAVMRRDADKAKDYAQRHDVPKWYSDVDALLADDTIDTVYVATPDALHAEMTIRAAQAGKNVLVEKAMATNTADCNRMITACEQAGVTLAVAYYRRGYPTILRAKQLIDQGALGKVRDIWINDEFPLSHRLDLMHFLCGDIESVRAVEAELAPCSHAVTGTVLELAHASGAACRTNAGWDENLVPETLDIRCEAGRIRVLDLKAGLLVTDIAGQKTTENLGPLPATHWGLIDNFVKHQRDQALLACDGHEGRKSTVILDIVEVIQPDGPPVAVDYSA